MMMGCLGMSCLRISDQATRPLSPPSESCDDSLTASSDDVKSSSASSESSKESSCGRIKLSDGRLLAYKERGVPKSEASYRVVIVHGFASNKDMNFMASQVRIDGPFEYLCVLYVDLCDLLHFLCKILIKIGTLDVDFAILV